MRRSVTPLISIILLTLLAFWSVNGAAEATSLETPTAGTGNTPVATSTPAGLEATQRPTFTATPTMTATATHTPVATSTPRPTPTPTQPPPPAPTAPPTPSAAIQTNKAIFIDQATQMMYVYEDDVLIRTMAVSTGIPADGTYTPAWQGHVGHYVGTFSSFGTTQDEGWYLFQSDGGILIHGNPYNIVDGVKVYVELEALGHYPASHGCIRLSPEDAVWFTQWNPQGAYCVISEMPEGMFR